MSLKELDSALIESGGFKEGIGVGNKGGSGLVVEVDGARGVICWEVRGWGGDVVGSCGGLFEMTVGVGEDVVGFVVVDMVREKAW